MEYIFRSIIKLYNKVELTLELTLPFGKRMEWVFASKDVRVKCYIFYGGIPFQLSSLGRSKQQKKIQSKLNKNMKQFRYAYNWLDYTLAHADIEIEYDNVFACGRRFRTGQKSPVPMSLLSILILNTQKLRLLRCKRYVNFRGSNSAIS